MASVVSSNSASESGTTTMNSGVTGAMTSISNGLCRFNPTSRKGKLIFLLQTIFLSFSPIVVLLAQNGVKFSEMIERKNLVNLKDAQVTEVDALATLVLQLQRERLRVAYNIFTGSDDDDDDDRKVDKKEKDYEDDDNYEYNEETKSYDDGGLQSVFAATDAALASIKWRAFGRDKVFSNKLRFQIKLDDFRENAETVIAAKNASMSSDVVVVGFYNKATTALLTALEQDISEAQSSFNWRLLLTYYNMIKMIESLGVGLVYGLRFFAQGKLRGSNLVKYVEHDALVTEYLVQVRELIPKDMEKVLDKLYKGEGYDVVTKTSKQLLANTRIQADASAGQAYYKGVSAFARSLSEVLDLLTTEIKLRGEEEMYQSMLSQIWGIGLLILVLLISPLIIVSARNAIFAIQMFATSVEQKAVAMKRQQRKRNKLIYKMLPKEVVEKMKNNAELAETFESCTLFFSSVVDFSEVTKTCTALQVVQFLNELYTVMDGCMDSFDVYKVETISDSYLVASGLPRRNGDRHAREICAMALTLQLASSKVIRPDCKPHTIMIKAGVHTGSIVAGVVGSKMPRYCLFGDTINTASRMQSNSLPGRIQLSLETKMLLDMAGGFQTEPRGTINIKGKGQLETFFLNAMERK